MKIFEEVPELEGLVEKKKNVAGKLVTFFVIQPNVKQMSVYEKMAVEIGKNKTTEGMKHWAVFNLVANEDGTPMFPIKERDEAKKQFKNRAHLLNAMFEGVSEVIKENILGESELDDLGEQ